LSRQVVRSLSGRTTCERDLGRSGDDRDPRSRQARGGCRAERLGLVRSGARGTSQRDVCFRSNQKRGGCTRREVSADQPSARRAGRGPGAAADASGGPRVDSAGDLAGVEPPARRDSPESEPLLEPIRCHGPLVLWKARDRGCQLGGVERGEREELPPSSSDYVGAGLRHLTRAADVHAGAPERRRNGELRVDASSPFVPRCDGRGQSCGRL
jgi:hypothetical protein